MSAEIALGQALAELAHPVLAWQVLTARGRVRLAAIYFGAGYAVVLTALFLVGR